MDSKPADYVPFSNPKACTFLDRTAPPKTKGGKWRAFRVLCDVDAPMYAVFVRDEKGRLPEEPNYMAPLLALAIYYGRHGEPSENAAERIREFEELRKTKDEPEHDPDTAPDEAQDTEPAAE